MTSGYSETKIFSNNKLAEIRAALSDVQLENGFVVTCGSYARKEASESSDIDFFSVFADDSSRSNNQHNSLVRDTISKHVSKMPAVGGAFAKDVTKGELLENYGGDLDVNETITRRMLFLLEGDRLTGQDEFEKLRRDIIERYVQDTPRDHQLAFYLLNDMIRYWRTMTVDYAHKTDPNGNEPKPWATRNIKLIFSRKIIYASGLFSVALTADRRENKKCDILEELFSMTPIDRIKYVCGDAASKRLFDIYDIFLDRLSDAGVRSHLDGLSRAEKENDEAFRELKNEGHYFSRELMGLYHKTFHASHPIHMAVIF